MFNGRSADGDDATAFVASALNHLGGVTGDRIRLAMDLMLLDHFDPDRLERSETDVQRHFRDSDAAGADAIKNRRREVQSSGGSSNRSERLGINRLVLLAVEQRVGTVDVGRKRYVPDALQNSEEISDRIEAQMALAECVTV